MADVKEKVVSIIVEKLGVNPEDVVETASFTNDLGADSLDVVEMLMNLEEEYGITVPEEDAVNINSLLSHERFPFKSQVLLDSIHVFWT